MESILRIDALAAEWVDCDCEDVLHGESTCFDIAMKMYLTYEFDEKSDCGFMDIVSLRHQATRYQHYLVRRIELPQHTPQIFGALFR